MTSPRLAILSLTLTIITNSAVAQLEFEDAPISYHEAAANDDIARLQQKIDSGEVKLEFDDDHGYLPAVLKALDISPTSQVLVFSKTSLQLRRIRPETPRAVYFNDDNYVGWVQRGDVMEVSTVDPQLGAVFYTLAQEKVETPQFIRDKGQCLTCHASSRTKGVPGHLMRSVFSAPDGQPQIGSGTYNSDHSSPFEKRWGGWYVTGTHGSMRHMGNVVTSSRKAIEDIDVEAGANITSLADLVDISPYLTPHSDIVALMVLEHQVQMHNLLTLASFETRSALHYDQVMNAALERPKDHRTESTSRRIATVADKVVKYALMTDEFVLESPVKGTSGFREQFEKLDPLDANGRSLRQLDLNTRLFRYPASFLLKSPSFAALPPEVKQIIQQRLKAALEGEGSPEEFPQLSDDDRKNLLALLGPILKD
ncbi:MAG: hypothetical protein KDA88_16685 [Planctomycetaceae bacterium]|nr:hypothetical protein [Planctomycetaceae bacterium]